MEVAVQSVLSGFEPTHANMLKLAMLSVPYSKQWSGEDVHEAMCTAAELLIELPRPLADMMANREQFQPGEKSKQGHSIWQLLTHDLGYCSITGSSIINVLSLLVCARTAGYGEPYFVYESERHLQPLYYEWREHIKTNYTAASLQARLDAFLGEGGLGDAVFPVRSDEMVLYGLDSLWTDRSVDNLASRPGKINKWRFADEGPDPRLPALLALEAAQ